MDGDDLCAPERLEQQIRVFENHPEFSIVSSWMNLFDETGIWGISKSPEYPAADEIVTGNPICHAPVMIRRNSLIKIGGYSEDKKITRVEDVDLWM